MIGFYLDFLLTTFLMKITNWITQEEVIVALNTAPPNPSSYIRFLEKFVEALRVEEPSEAGFFRKLFRDWEDAARRRCATPSQGFIQNYLAKAIYIEPESPPAGNEWQLPATISRQESVPFRVALTSAHLREHVDSWIDTGRQPNGSEVPRERNLNRAGNGLQAVWSYLAEARVMLSPATVPDGFSLEVDITARSAYSGKVRGFFESQVVEAKRLFVGIMASEWKDRLCKCRYRLCGRYFIHSKPRASYRHGTFCNVRHAKSASAESSTRARRISGAKWLIDKAAIILRKKKNIGPEWQKDAGLKRDVAFQLCSVIAANRYIHYRNEVGLNWVTLHQVAIERRRLEIS